MLRLTELSSKGQVGYGPCDKSSCNKQCDFMKGGAHTFSLVAK